MVAFAAKFDLRSMEHDDAAAKGQTLRADLFTKLLDRTHHEAS